MLYTKKMILNENQVSLLKYLLSSSDAVAVHALAKIFQLSSFAIRNELEDLEYFCDSFGLELFKRPGRGICIYGSQRRKRNCLFALGQLPYKKQYTRKESLLFIVCSLAKVRDFVKLHSLACVLNVSTTTVLNILREFEQTEEYLHSGVYIETRKGVGLRLQGDLMALVAFLSSFILPHLKAEIYWERDLEPLNSYQGFSKDILVLLELDVFSLKLAQQVLTNLYGDKWVHTDRLYQQHALLFIHLCFLIKRRGEYDLPQNKSRTPVYNQVLSDICLNNSSEINIYIKKKSEILSQDFFLWANSLSPNILLSNQRIQDYIDSKICNLNYLESLNIEEGISDIHLHQIEEFFSLSIADIWASWLEKKLPTRLSKQHVFVLLFEYVYANIVPEAVFTGMIVLPVPDRCSELLMSNYCRSLFRNSIRIVFRQAVNVCDLEPVYHNVSKMLDIDFIFMVTQEEVIKSNLNVPVCFLPRLVLDPSQEKIAKDLIQETVALLIRQNMSAGSG
ncbi:MAG: hypothetical protein AAF975_01155 [Spirochaetota bacterium]